MLNRKTNAEVTRDVYLECTTAARLYATLRTADPVGSFEKHVPKAAAL